MVPGRHPGADRGAPIDVAALRRVLVVRPDNIGDVVTTGPALRAMHAAAPRASIDLLVSPAGAEAARMLPGVDRAVVASVSWQQLAPDGVDPLDEWRLLADLTRSRYDAMIVFTTSTQSPWPVAQLGLLAGIAIRVVHSVEFGGAVATHWVTPPPPEAHQVDRCLHLVVAAGLASATPSRTLALRLPPAATGEADTALAGSGLPPATPFAAVVPGASAAARRYPPQRFGAAAAAIAAAGLPVRVIGSARERELVAAVVAAAGHPQVRALPVVSVAGFAAVLRKAAVAVTNNSGGLHLADAVGTPVAAVWAGTDPPAVMRPRSVPAELLAAAVPCAPCAQLHCPYDHGCVAVPPGDVAAAALRLTAGAPAATDQEVRIPC